MQYQVHESIDEIPAPEWNALNHEDNPFLCHEFLAALEHHGCVGPRYGWLPRHISAWEGGVLVGVMPLYLKDNSYGEFVFDFAWAEAYRRQGRAYYPKLVSAIPYTPASGERLLLARGREEATGEGLVARAVSLAGALGVSSVHWLFPTRAQQGQLKAQGLVERLGCQFHWSNRGYGDFDDFLAALSSKRRKNIRRERRQVREAGIRLELLHGPEVSEAQWRTFARFYTRTFEDYGSLPTLNEGFFREVGRTLGRRVILILAHDQAGCVGAALLYRGGDTLYGRHWGSLREHPGLHFEACYYQGIEYCIREGLARFEPGAQGEHKIWRGFLPTLTYSAHWIADPGFRSAIIEFLHRERPLIADYARTLSEASPYRKGD